MRVSPIIGGTRFFTPQRAAQFKRSVNWIHDGKLYVVQRAVGPNKLPVVLKSCLTREICLGAGLYYLRNEAERLNYFRRQPRVVSYLGSFFPARDPEESFIAMEYIKGFNLLELTEKLKPGYALRIIKEMAECLAPVHAAGLAFVDWSPLNYMYDEERGYLRIIDFSFVRPSGFYLGSERPDSPIGTPPYLSPARWRGAAPTIKHDLFALGIYLFELCNGFFPVDHMLGASPSVSLGVGIDSPDHNPSMPQYVKELAFALTETRPPESRKGSYQVPGFNNAGEVAAYIARLPAIQNTEGDPSFVPSGNPEFLPT